MYAAPSTRYRIKYYLEVRGIESVSFNEYILRVLKIIFRFFSENKYYIIMVIFLMIIYVALNAKKKEKAQMSESLMLLILSSVSCGALIMSPYIETRAFFINNFFMIVCILFYVEKIYQLINIRFRKIYAIIGIMMVILNINEGMKIYNIYKEYWIFCNDREKAIEKLNSDAEFDFVDYPYPYRSRILTTREDWVGENKAVLSDYYGIKVN